MTRTALVTGGNRGIGLGVCRQLAAAGLAVLLIARDEARGRAAAEALRRQGGNVRFELLDVADAATVAACAERLATAGVAVDVLVNKASIPPSPSSRSPNRSCMRRWGSTCSAPFVPVGHSSRPWRSADTDGW